MVLIENCWKPAVSNITFGCAGYGTVVAANGITSLYGFAHAWRCFI